jgi:prepilin-type N-terminal cleavage/methylation domain-containing protein
MRGFALPELLVAMALSVLLAGALLSVIQPSNDAFLRMPAVNDLHRRVRAATEVIASRLLGACGAGPAASHNPLGVEVPCLFPYGLGTLRSATPGGWWPETLSVLTGLPGAVPASLLVGLDPGGTIAQLDCTHCPAASPACGLRAGDALAFLGPGGRWELARAALVTGPQVTLTRRGPAAGRPFPAGSLVIPVDPVSFYLRGPSGSDPPQLRRHDAAVSDLPLLDHVVSMEVRLFGESAPPVARPDGTGATYGPPPPPAGVDDLDDSWGAGENCVFARVDGTVVSRLPALDANPLGLVELLPAALADGPWCPDGGSPSAFDADLLRVRRVRVRLRLEAGPAALRGRGPLFQRPGTSSSGLRFLPDREVNIEVVPRGAGGGR